jgi:low temperature requirement protein LtrA
LANLSVVSPEDQSVTFVELFFDLVFVFSVTQIAGLFHGNIELKTLGSSALVFWLVWWAWTQFTWALNAANTDHPRVQMGTLLATAVAFFMAVEVPNAFGDGALWFALAYVAVRSVGLILYKWVASSDPAMHSAVRTFALISLTGLAAVVGGALLGGTAQYLLWGLAILLDVFAARVGGDLEGWNLHPGHFAERHGLIVIIALGECLIIAASGLTDAPRTLGVLGIGFLAVALSCGLWWSYFPYARPALEHAMGRHEGSARAGLARDIFSLAHFPMLCGIVAFAVAVEIGISHPDEVFPLDARIALASGFFLFLGGAALALWRAAGRVLRTRLWLGVAASASIVAVEAIPHMALGILLLATVTVVAVEHRSLGPSGLPDPA